MSLISYVFSYFVRRQMKFRPVGTDDELIKEGRRRMNDPRRIPRRTPRDMTVDEVVIGEGPRAGLRDEWVIPAGARPDRAIIYFHGGGYIGGSPRHYRKTTFYLARLTKAKIFVPDYRLAPEHLCPAAVEDGLDAYRHVLEKFAPNQVAFVGDSAGGGLLLATMHKARQENVELPAAGVCFSPYTDLAATGASLEANERTCAMFYAETVRRAAPVYLGGRDPRDPLASPLYGDFTGFPPLQVFVSASETLLDDSLRLIVYATDAGVRVEKVIRENLPHVWPVFPEYLPEAREALRQVAEFIAGVWAEREKAEAVRQPEYV